MEILLYKVRRTRGYSCRELSQRSGISKTSINDIENEKISPTLDTLGKLAKALDCRITDLFEE